MNVLETEWWTLLVPPEWWAESEDHSILIGDRDDVGTIEISTLRRDEGDFSADEAAAVASKESPEVGTWKRVSVGHFDGVSGVLVEEDAAIREWYLAGGPVLLYITYSCDTDNQGLDDAAVDEILDTLALI